MCDRACGALVNLTDAWPRDHALVSNELSNDRMTTAISEMKEI